MNLINLFKKVSQTGLVKPLPLSGIANEIAESIDAVKTQNNYKRLIKLVAYLVMGVGIWYVIYRGLATCDQVKEILQLVNEQIG